MALEGPPRYFDALLNEKPTVAELYEFVRVGAKWLELGILLELDSVNLNGIDELNKDCDFKAKKMFELWLTTKHSATRRQIIETLKKEAIGMNAVAVDYEKALETKCESTSILIVIDCTSLLFLIDSAAATLGIPIYISTTSTTSPS